MNIRSWHLFWLLILLLTAGTAISAISEIVVVVMHPTLGNVVWLLVMAVAVAVSARVTWRCLNRAPLSWAAWRAYRALDAAVGAAPRGVDLQAPGRDVHMVRGGSWLHPWVSCYHVREAVDVEPGEVGVFKTERWVLSPMAPWVGAVRHLDPVAWGEDEDGRYRPRLVLDPPRQETRRQRRARSRDLDDVLLQSGLIFGTPDEVLSVARMLESAVPLE